MRNFKVIKIFFAVVMMNAGASAQESELRYDSYPDENQIERESLLLSNGGARVRVNGIKFNSLFRTESIDGDTNPPFTLGGKSLSKDGIDKFLADCDFRKKYKSFKALHKKNNVFKLKGEFTPINRLVIGKALGDVKDETKYVSIDYRVPPTAEGFGPHSEAAGFDAGTVRNFLETQLMGQKQALWESGFVEFDLTGMDALVCDLVSKKGQIVFVTKVDFAGPLPSRTSVIRPHELKLIIERLEKTKSYSDSPGGMATQYIGQLWAEIGKVLAIEFGQFGGKNFERLSVQLIDLQSGRLKIQSTDSQAVSKVAQSLDTVKYLRGVGSTFAHPQVLVEGN